MSSRMHRARKRMSIWGRKPMTAPTPPTIPLTRRLVSASPTPFSSHQLSSPDWIGSSMNPFSQSVHQVPIPTISKSPQENPMIPRKTTASTQMNMGMPQTLCVTILSTLSEKVPSSLRGAFFMSCSTISAMRV